MHYFFRKDFLANLSWLCKNCVPAGAKSATENGVTFLKFSVSGSVVSCISHTEQSPQCSVMYQSYSTITTVQCHVSVTLNNHQSAVSFISHTVQSPQCSVMYQSHWTITTLQCHASVILNNHHSAVSCISYTEQSPQCSLLQNPAGDQTWLTSTGSLNGVYVLVCVCVCARACVHACSLQ